MNSSVGWAGFFDHRFVPPYCSTWARKSMCPRYQAYDHPKFVEDMVRDVAAVLDDEPRIAGYVVESENVESIHNHSAYALIERDKESSR